MEPEENTVRDVVKNESARQTVILGFTLVLVGIMYVIQNDDERRRMKMAAALVTKRFAQRQADWWQLVADRAATIYNGEKA